jgi:hypothetical protein
VPGILSVKVVDRSSVREQAPHQQRPAEGVNALIKTVKKVGYGFRNLDNYRLRLPVTAGVDWRTAQWQARLPPQPEAAHHVTALDGLEPGPSQDFVVPSRSRSTSSWRSTATL